ncbi:MAG: O-antigen ligase family protein [Deltaproteobacteria bacterium]|nr:O-antigen ligase family protein [Deltaproteobacteria bacterium]
MRQGSITVIRTVKPLGRELAWGRRTVLFGSAGLLIFAPLAYGAVHPWSYYPMALAAGFLSLMVLTSGIHAVWTGPASALAWPRPPLWWAGLGLAALAVLQLTPLPQGLLEALSPGAVRLRALGSGCGLAAYLPLSLNPYKTGLESLKLWPAVIVFYLLIYTVNSRRQLVGLARLILGVALFEALYGFYHLRSNIIWGWKNPYGTLRLNGTFINCDHLATLLAMAALLGFGLFLARRETVPALPAGLTGRERLRRWSRAEYLEPRLRTYAWLFAVLLLAAALVFTGSRGGMLSLLLGFVVMGLLVLSRSSARAHLYLIGAFVAAALLYSLFLGSSPYLARFLDLNHQGRYFAFRGALAIWREFPGLGAGLGAFGDVFYRFAPVELKGVQYLETHSDWLQLLAETGLAGFALAAAAWLLFFGGLVRKWRERRDPLVRGLGLGGLAALAAGAFHALVEFPFHIPALALIYAAVAALVYLLLHHHQPPEYFSYASGARLARRPRALLAVCLVLALCQAALIVSAWRWWRAEAAAPTEIDSTRAPGLDPSAGDYRRALLDNPWNSRVYAGLAALLEREEPGPAAGSLEAAKLLQAAVYQAPASWEHRYQLGELYLRHFRDSPARCLPGALQELAAAAALFPASGHLHYRLGSVLAWAEQYYSGLVPPELRGRAAHHLELAVQLEPRLQKYLK